MCLAIPQSIPFLLDETDIQLMLSAKTFFAMEQNKFIIMLNKNEFIKVSSFLEIRIILKFN